LGKATDYPDSQSAAGKSEETFGQDTDQKKGGGRGSEEDPVPLEPPLLKGQQNRPRVWWRKKKEEGRKQSRVGEAMTK